MKQMRQVLLADDNPADAASAQEALAGAGLTPAEYRLKAFPCLLDLLNICDENGYGNRAYRARAGVSKPGNLKDYLSAVQSIEQFWFGSASLPRKEK
jgi:hypothetical protein